MARELNQQEAQAVLKHLEPPPVKEADDSGLVIVFLLVLFIGLVIGWMAGYKRGWNRAMKESVKQDSLDRFDNETRQLVEDLW